MNARFFLLLIVGFSFVFAASVDDVAKAYMNSGESLAIANVSAGGVDYHLLKANGEPVVVLLKSGVDYKVVSDDLVLANVASSYLDATYNSSFNSSFFDAVNSSYYNASQLLYACVEGATQFEKILPGRYISVGTSQLPLYFMIKRLVNTTLKAENAAIISMNRTIPLFLASLDEFSASFTEFYSKKGEQSVTEKSKATAKLASSVKKVREYYTNMSTYYATLVNSKGDGSTFSGSTLKYLFYVGGNRKDCAYNTTVGNSLSTIESEASSRVVKSSAEIVSQIKNATVLREARAARQQAIASKAEVVSKAADVVGRITSNYSDLPKVKLSELSVKQAAVQAAYDLVKNASSTEVVNAKSAELDNTFSSLEQMAASYEKALPEYRKAIADVENASAHVAAAEKRFSASDERVAALTQNLTAVKAMLASNEERLSNASFVTSFASVSSAAREITVSASAIAPKETLLDPVTIGGIVLVILVLLATIWYFKKLKENAPPKEFKVR